MGWFNTLEARNSCTKICYNNKYSHGCYTSSQYPLQLAFHPDFVLFFYETMLKYLDILGGLVN